MVRTTIACARCRKLKVKCVHEGIPPCRNCWKKGAVVSGSCILTGPELKSTLISRTPKGLPGAKRGLSGVSPATETPSPLEDGASPIVSYGMIQHACLTFTRKFPELRFLHWPSFSKTARAAWNDKQNTSLLKPRLLCIAIMAVCGPTAYDSIQPETLASYARENLSLIDPPDLYTVQSLVVLSMYEWGMGNGYRAWMYTGTATRMMQSLQILVKQSSLTAVEREVQNRTLWSCFIVDRLVFCGRSQPFTLSLFSLGTHWPIGEQDFAFGQVSQTAHRTDGEQGPLEYMEGDIDHYYGVLVRGFDIWARVLKFIVSGGRRQTGMCLPENHPWVEGSPWRLLYDELQAWRDCQVERLRYPETHVEGHAALGIGEQFGYVNLIYYVSLLFLMREYIPFLPHPESEPSGPVDPPLLTLEAPTTWWSDRAEELFSSSANIVKLLEELEAADASLYTPFAGFCNFSAATMNLYVSYFPRMNLGRSNNISSIISINMEYLDQLRKLRPMGEGWWVTTQHVKALYEQAIHNRREFHGRTRADFAALEYSIHDSRGQPPNPGQSLPLDDPEGESQQSWDSNGEDVTEVAKTFQKRGTIQESIESSGFTGAPDHQDFGQVWPMWGEQQNIPFAVEGVPFDFNLDTFNS